MVRRGKGVVVKITFETLTSTYVILDLETHHYYRYHGQDYRKLEFGLSDYVTYNKLPGVPYVVAVKNYYLEVQNIPREQTKTEDSELNIQDDNVNTEEDDQRDIP